MTTAISEWMQPYRDARLREHAITLYGRRVTLRPMTEADWPILLVWNNDPDVLFFAEGDDTTSHSLEAVQAIYRAVSRAAFCFIIEVDDQAVGECQLQRMNLQRILERYPGLDCRRIDITIGEKRLWGRGLGTEAIGLLVQFGLDQEGADAIFGCDIGGHNPRSRRAFEKNGFVTDATYAEPPDRKGQAVHDLVLMRERYHTLQG